MPEVLSTERNTAGDGEDKPDTGQSGWNRREGACYALLGAQWGDEGKGKITDALSDRMRHVVRFQGGANAGHTIHVGPEKYVLHLVPSGILNPDTQNHIGCGCVVDPIALAAEISGLQGRGIRVDPDRLTLDGRTHLVTPAHRFLDRLTGGKVGTTGRGIGPTYMDKAARLGIRADALGDGSLAERYAELVARVDEICNKLHGTPLGPDDTREADFLATAGALSPLLGDVGEAIYSAEASGENVLFEGAQGSLLDLDHGTYPFVTSSSTTIGGVFSGCGAWVNLDHRIGIFKAYCTRVGNGPFPTEAHGEEGDRLREAGREFGATTGRPRRCGWLDIPLMKLAIRLNGFNHLAMTKLDCLSGLPTIPVAVDRDAAGAPVYEKFEGWSEDLTECRSPEDLPPSCLRYLEAVEDLLEQRIGLVSVGPGRSQTLVRDSLWLTS